MFSCSFFPSTYFYTFATDVLSSKSIIKLYSTNNVAVNQC